MTCELSSSFSKENRLQPSTQIWNEYYNTYYANRGGFAFGSATRVVPYNNDVYTFVGMPGSQTDHPTNDTADDQGSIYIYRSGSSGFDTELIIGPGGSAAPVGGATPSNYTGINLGSEDWDHANLGKSIDAISSSAGLHFLVAAPGLNQLAGRIFLFQSSSSGIQMVDDSNIMSGSSSDPYWNNSNTEGQRSQDYSQAGTMKSSGDWSQTMAILSYGYGSPNDAVSLVFDDNEENLYISFYDSLLSDSVATDNAGGIRLYKSSSLGGVEHLKDIIVSSPITKEQVGSAHQMIVSDGKVYIAASGYAIPRDPGQAYLFTYDINAGTYTEDIYYPASSFSDPDGEIFTENFGTGTPDIVSGSDGIYILQGSGKRHDTDPYTDYYGLGRLYLFKSSSLGGIEVHSVFTGSNDDNELGYNFFGGQAQLMSGTSGFIIVSSELSGALTGPDEWWGNGVVDPARIWVYETGSNTNNAYYINGNNSTEISSLSDAYYMGKVLDARISNDGETLYLAASDPERDTAKGATILYGWGLSGSCSQQQQQGDNNMSTSDKRGIAVYSGSSGAVHKFLDDGSSVIGTDTSKLHAMQGNLTIDSTASYDIEAQGDVSASAFHGDGSALTNINATPDISESSADFYFVGAAAIGSDQSLVGESTNGPVFYEADKQMRVHALSASGHADLNSTLNVQGVATLQSDMSASGDVYGENATVADILDVGGDANITANLDVVGDSTFSTVDASSTLTVGGLATMNGNLDVAGTSTFQDEITAAGASFDGDVTIEAANTFDVSSATLTTSADQKKAIMEGADDDIDIGAYSLTAETLVSDVTTGTPPLTVTSTTEVANLNAAKLSGADWDAPLAIGGTTAAAANFTTLAASDNADFDGDLDVAGATSLAATSVLTNIRGTLSVDEAATFDTTITVTGNADMNGDLDVAGDSTLGTNNTDSVSVNGHLKMATFDAAIAGTDATQLETMADDPSSYNGAMVYVGANTGLTGAAAFYFDNPNKWYFCENGDWFPSPFNS